ncbi:MAG TPA: FKBP-type peptidyl-prolyl cis-trans isomerase [Saprospiraceae bacterium]|nr:FKBP-type peptidyl-prolyl cis-trans isomerase [Saprospiraceae bacterium]MCB9271404.1 FKBP-type peptidyl-prolyl cis-trans isomerase [Lewinellaceae bacterium]HPG07234.1 FKBP-type peptidyl-prolyl cis-trans isomerase [Saprospiraceae bacterium]HPR01895.1 FKBP-type peptidyl-prolyl cis-trans isomerase [Saprospiraceae bacterium]HQU52244.1 FKBP-type peptidyl-prolyl cis-trans isomerase [Saprospiraceae bacterium]
MKKLHVFWLVAIPLLIHECHSDHDTRHGKESELITTASGLQYQSIQAGKGRSAQAGDTVLIYETASYRNGTVLYTNENSERPISVLIGGNQATKGEDEGLRGMKEGEIRLMIIPPALSRRSTYPPNLSPDSILVVRVLLDKIL